MRRKQLTDAQRAVFGSIIAGDHVIHAPKEATIEAAKREGWRQKIAKAHENARMRIDEIEVWNE